MSSIHAVALLGAALFTCAFSVREAFAESSGGGGLTERMVVAAALKHNPTLAAAAGDLRRAQLLEQAEDHRYSVTLGLDGSATHTRSPSLGVFGVTTPENTTYAAGAELSRHTVLGSDLKLRVEGWQVKSTSSFLISQTTTPTQTTYSLGPGYGTSVKLSLTQPLLRGAGRDIYYANLDAARVSQVSARSARDQTASQLLLDVLTAFWELDYASRSVEIQKRAIEVATAQRDETALRVKTGSAAPVDVLSFETNVATIEEELATAQADQAVRAGELLRLMGDSELQIGSDTNTSVATPEPELESTPGARESIRQRALSVSYELAQQRAAVELATVQARTADESYRPKLDLDAYVQAQGLGNRSLSPMYDQMTGLGAVSAHVGLAYQAPLDGTQRGAERERALMAIETAKQRLTAIEQRVLADLEKAVTREESSRKRVGLADATLTIAKQQYEAEAQRFRTGSATALQVREAENSVRNAELRASRARADWVESKLTLEHLSGKLLERWSKGGGE